MKSKILLVSNLRGQLQKLAQLLRRQKEKGTVFHAVFCVGQTLSPEVSLLDFIQLRQQLIAPTYFIDCSVVALALQNLFPQEKQLFPNFSFLGRSGVKEIAGLRVGYLNGQSGPQQLYKKQIIQKGLLFYSNKYYTIADVQLLIKQGKQADLDLLFLNEPPSILSGVGLTDAKDSRLNRTIEQVAAQYVVVANKIDHQFTLKPFTSCNGFPCRPLAFGHFGSKVAKYIFAFQVMPIAGQNQADRAKRYPQQIQIVARAETDHIAQQYDSVLFRGFPIGITYSQVEEYISSYYPVSGLKLFTQRRAHNGKGIVVLKSMAMHSALVRQSGKNLYRGQRIYYQLNDTKRFKGCWFCQDKPIVEFGDFRVLFDKCPIGNLHLQLVARHHTDKVDARQYENTKNQLIQKLNRAKINVLVLEKGAPPNSQFNHFVTHLLAYHQQQDLADNAARICRQNKLQYRQYQGSSQSRLNSLIRLQFYETKQSKFEVELKKAKGLGWRELACRIMGEGCSDWRTYKHPEDKLLKAVAFAKQILG